MMLNIYRSRDFEDTQGDDGLVPYTAPTHSGAGGPAWSGFLITLPWQVYRTFGDTSLLKARYGAMQRQLTYWNSSTDASGLMQAPNGTSDLYWLGDWISPHGSQIGVDSPNVILFQNCYVAYCETLGCFITF